MLDRDRRDIDVGLGEALVGVAEEGPGVAAKRFVAIGRNAAVGSAAVMEIFVTEVDAGVWPGEQRRRRVDAVALEVDVVAETVAVFVERRST